MSIKLPNLDNLIVWKIHWNTCCVRCMSMLGWKLNFTESPKVMIINTFCTVTVPRQFCGLVNLTFDQSYIVQCFLTSLHFYTSRAIFETANLSANCRNCTCKTVAAPDPHLDCDCALRIKIMKMMTQVLIKTRYNVSVSISNSRFQNIELQWVDIMSIKITLIIAHLESQIMFIVLIYSLSLSLPKRRSLVSLVNWITLPRTDCRS